MATTTATARGRSSDRDGGQPLTRWRGWAQNVSLQTRVLDARLDIIMARQQLATEQQGTAANIRNLLSDARLAASSNPPRRRDWGAWWRGSQVETAYQMLHAAEGLLCLLLEHREVRAEIPDVVAKLQSALPQDDPRRGGVAILTSLTENPHDLPYLRERLRKAVDLANGASDQQHARLRSFRNLLLSATVALSVFMVLFVLVVSQRPTWVSLCFGKTGQTCPAGGGAASGGDIVVVALCGMLGGVLAGVLSISRLQGTSTPYNVPTLLAVLKVPFGAMTAVAAIMVIRGDFVPGLSNLDSQAQILAYALLFGYAQQLLTKMIDKQAQSMLDSMPAKDAHRAHRVAAHVSAPVLPAPVATFPTPRAADEPAPAT